MTNTAIADPSPLPISPIGIIAAALKASDARLRADSKVVFVCGGKSGHESPTARDVFLEYSKKNLHEYRFFKAEDAFERLLEKYDLLSLEDKLTAYSDCIIIILESPGAIAELGAFTIKEELAQMVLAINDKKFFKEESFIALGPLQKIKSKSKFGETIYVNLEAVLAEAPEIATRLRVIKRRKSIAVSMENWEAFGLCEAKTRMLFLADLITLFSPVSKKELTQILKTLFNIEEYIDVDVELSVLEALSIVSHKKNYYFRSLNEKPLFFKFTSFDFVKLRSAVIVFYQKKVPVKIKNLAKHSLGGGE